MSSTPAPGHMPSHPHAEVADARPSVAEQAGGDGVGTPVFGRLATAMVTPFTESGDVDLVAARALARILVDQQRNDALVVNGTTGESPTTTEDEKVALVNAVVEEVGDRAQVIAGVGSNFTAHTVASARAAAQAGAHGVLVVTPYYSRPTQRGVVAHFEQVAAATELPIMVYDIPGRAGIPIATQTLIELAQMPTVRAVKDAKADPVASAQVMAATDLDYYSGDDAMTLPFLSVGAVGVVGTSTHFTGAATADLLSRWFSGDAAGALEIYRRLLPSYLAVFAEPGCSMVKGALRELGWGNGVQRLPMVDARPELVELLLEQLRTAGLV